jgi:hypothetical protein
LHSTTPWESRVLIIASNPASKPVQPEERDCWFVSSKSKSTGKLQGLRSRVACPASSHRLGVSKLSRHLVIQLPIYYLALVRPCVNRHSLARRPSWGRSGRRFHFHPQRATSNPPLFPVRTSLNHSRFLDDIDLLLYSARGDIRAIRP